MAAMEDESKFKAGHAQAVRAGGMRIVQHKNNTSSADKCVPAADVANAAWKVSTSPPKMTVVPVHAHNDYPTVAVQKTHDKPSAGHDIRQHFCPKPSIHQPRK